MEPYHIRQIKLSDCLKLRKEILWPILQTQDCIAPEEENAIHYGYFINNKIVSCLSVFYHTPTRRQIRKFSTHTNYQGKGVGSTLFKTVLQELKKENVETVFLNAVDKAAKFYEKFNFTYFDQPYTKNNIVFLPMQLDLTK